MVAGPASTPVPAVAIAIFVILVGTGSADVAVLLAESPVAEPVPGTGAVRPAPDDRHSADGRRRSGPPRHDAVRSSSRRALSQPANSSAGTAAGGPLRLPFAWTVVALATVLGFCVGVPRLAGSLELALSSLGPNAVLLSAKNLSNLYRNLPGRAEIVQTSPKSATATFGKPKRQITI